MAYVLTIRERNHFWAGRPPAMSTYPTREAAEAALLEYVRDNWEEELDTDPPDDPGSMIEEYFEDVLEAYEITELA
jgi:hypothetical protein